MSFRGRGRGRGRGGFGGGGFRPAKQLPLELFPDIVELGKAKELDKAEYSSKIQLIKWSSSLQKYWNSSPYYYEDRSERAEKIQKLDIERYSDRKLQATKAKPPLWHFIKLDTDHVPAELARGEKKEKHVKRVRWNPESDSKKLDVFEKLEQKFQGQEGAEKKENEEEEENEIENEEDEGEFSDEGDYEQAEYCDDDEDDFNMADDGDDEPLY